MQEGAGQGQGPTTRALEVRVKSLAVDKVQAESWKKGTPLLLVGIDILREIEVRNLRVKDVMRCDRQKWAAIRLATSKNDQEGSGVRRALSCCGKETC